MRNKIYIVILKHIINNYLALDNLMNNNFFIHFLSTFQNLKKISTLFIINQSIQR